MCTRRRSVRGRDALTLVEVIVVISVIALLLALSIPAMSAFRSQAMTTQCLSNLRQLTQAVMAYANMNDDHTPRSMHSALAHGQAPWGYALYPFLSGRPYVASAEPELFAGVYRCPHDHRESGWSYGLNVYFELSPDENAGQAWRRIGLVPHPSRTILFGEMLPSTMADHVMAHFWIQYGAPPEVDAHRHGSTCGCANVDGSVEDTMFRNTFDPQHSIDRWNPATAR